MTQQPIKHIIFDLTGVIFHIDKLKQFRSIGLMQSLLYIITHRKNPIWRFLEVLQKIHELDPHGYPIIYYKNTPLPRCMTELMCGTISNEQAMVMINGYVETLTAQQFFVSKREIKLIESILYMLAQPHAGLIALSPDPQIVALIATLKKNGYTLSLLSNFDRKSYDMIAGKYPDIFNLFDNLIISANINAIKPFPEIYAYTLKTLGVDGAACIFIDDQPENIVGARKLGLHGIHYTGYKSLIKSLKKHNINILC
jgi:HAD superfamily hydrolase (TIGR01509 family)